MDNKFKPYQKVILGLISSIILLMAVFYSIKLAQWSWPAIHQMNGIFTVIGAVLEPLMIGIALVYLVRATMKTLIGMYRSHVNNMTPWQKAQRFQKFRR